MKSLLLLSCGLLALSLVYVHPANAKRLQYEWHEDMQLYKTIPAKKRNVASKQKQSLEPAYTLKDTKRKQVFQKQQPEVNCQTSGFGSTEYFGPQCTRKYLSF